MPFLLGWVQIGELHCTLAALAQRRAVLLIRFSALAPLALRLGAGLDQRSPDCEKVCFAVASGVRAAALLACWCGTVC
jgi:hypothetical protein